MANSRKKHFNWNGDFVRFCELFTDILLIVFSFLLIHTYKSLSLSDISSQFWATLVRNFSDRNILTDIIIANAMYITVCVYLFLLYKNSVTRKRYGSVMGGVFISLLLVNVFLIVIQFILPIRPLVATDFLLTLLIQFVLIGIAKFIFYYFAISKTTRLILLCGPKDEADAVATKMLLVDEAISTLKYIYYEIDDKVGDDVYQYIDRVDEVYLTRSLSAENKNKIVLHCIAQKYIDVHLIPATYEIAIVNSNVDMAGDSLAFEIKSLHLSMEHRFIKRFFDLLISSISVIIMFPFMLIIAIIIKCSGAGSVIVKKKCVTRNKRIFDLYGFRTKHQQTGNLTKFGEFLELTKLEAVPELFNVLMGDISIVGPIIFSKDTLQELETMSNVYSYRLNVKSGLISYTNTTKNVVLTYEDQLRYDLYYIRKCNLWFDIKVLLLSLKALFARKRSLSIKLDTLQHVADLKECEVNRLTDNCYRFERDY